MTRPEADATEPCEPVDATAVIPLTRVGHRYVGRQRHEETLTRREYMEYALVWAAFVTIWLTALVLGIRAVESWWIW